MKYDVCIKVDAWIVVELCSESEEGAIAEALKKRPCRDDVEIGEWEGVQYATEVE